MINNHSLFFSHSGGFPVKKQAVIPLQNQRTAACVPAALPFIPHFQIEILLRKTAGNSDIIRDNLSGDRPFR